MADLSQFIEVFGDIKMVAKIQRIDPTTTGKGWRVTLEGGEQVYVFNQSFFNLIQPGASVDLSLQKQGRWTHVIGVAPAYFGATPGAPASASYPTPTPAFNPNPPAPSYVPGQIPAMDVSQQPGGGAIPGSTFTPPGSTNPPQFDDPPDTSDKNSSIVRQAILKSPVLAELYKNLGENMNVEGVIALAQRLEKYVHRGE